MRDVNEERFNSLNRYFADENIDELLICINKQIDEGVWQQVWMQLHADHGTTILQQIAVTENEALFNAVTSHLICLVLIKHVTSDDKYMLFSSADLALGLIQRAFDRGCCSLIASFCQAVLCSELDVRHKISLLSLKNSRLDPLARAAFNNGKAETIRAYCETILQSALSDTQKVKLLSQKNANGTPMAWMAFTNGRTETVRAYCETILQSTLSETEKVELLSQKNAKGYPMAWMAFEKGKAKTVRAYCETILQSTLSETEKVELLSQKNAKGYPMAWMAFEKGKAKTVRAYCETILQSALSDAQKVKLLSQKNDAGTPMASMAFTNGRTETIRAYCETILQSSLSDTEAVKLLSQKTTDGIPMAWWAFQEGKAETVKAYCETILQSALSDTEKVKLLSQKSDAGTLMAWMAFENGHADTVRAYCETILQSSLSETEKVKLLSQKYANRTPMAWMAFQEGKAKTVRAYCETILQSALSDTQKVKLLSQKNANGYPMAWMAFQNGHAGTVKAYCETILQSKLSDKQTVALLSQIGLQLNSQVFVNTFHSCLLSLSRRVSLIRAILSKVSVRHRDRIIKLFHDEHWLPRFEARVWENGIQRVVFKLLMLQQRQAHAGSKLMPVLLNRIKNYFPRYSGCKVNTMAFSRFSLLDVLRNIVRISPIDGQLINQVEVERKIQRKLLYFCRQSSAQRNFFGGGGQVDRVTDQVKAVIDDLKTRVTLLVNANLDAVSYLCATGLSKRFINPEELHDGLVDRTKVFAREYVKLITRACMSQDAALSDHARNDIKCKLERGDLFRLVRDFRIAVDVDRVFGDEELQVFGAT